MATLDSDIAFEDMLRRTAEAIQASTDEIKNRRKAPKPRYGLKIVYWSVAAGLGVAAAVTLATGYSALISDTPGLWIHRLMAIVIVQSVIIGAITMKISARLENASPSVRVAAGASGANTAIPPAVAAALQMSELPKIEPILANSPQAMPRKTAVGGTLAGRQFLQHLDGTIEIDTLVGRRRFVSIEAAKEFVGS